MQSSLCSRALGPRLAELQRMHARLPARSPNIRRLLASKSTDTDKEKYPELEDILGKPAKTFSELVDQMDMLIKHPRPPLNYGDALAKEELRRIDTGDLHVRNRIEKSPSDFVLRRRDWTTEKARYFRKMNALINRADRKADMKAEAEESLDQESDIEKKQRRRIWTEKVAGYKEFHKNLFTMKQLLQALDEDRSHSDSANVKENDTVNVEAKDGEVDTKGDVEFQKLLDQSWELYEDDLAYLNENEEYDTDLPADDPLPRPPTMSSNGTRPFGSRSFHTSRRIDGKPQPHPDRKSQDNTIPTFMRTSRRKVMLEKIKAGVKTDALRHAHKDKRRQGKPTRSLIKQVNLPTNEDFVKHASENYGEHIHVPIDASVSVGDIVELRTTVESNSVRKFGDNVQLSAIIQKTTGRFHFMAVVTRALVVGGREKALGFVAKGMMFDKSLLYACNLSSRDIKRILAYRDELEAYEAKHGKGQLTNAAEVQRLQQAQNQLLHAPIKGAYFDEPQADLQSAIEEASADSEWGAQQSFGAEASISMAANNTQVSTSAADAAATSEEGEVEEDVLSLIIRVMPRLVQTFRDKALRLMRTRYRELSQYWSLATAQGQKYVTVDSLAELIFGGNDGKPVDQVARLATYMHLISDTEHFIPSEEYLFVTNTFELRSSKEVEAIEKVRDLIRSNAPEFQRFVEKARKLVAYSYAMDPSDPLHAALSPDMSSLKESMTCSLTGSKFYPNFDSHRVLPTSTVPSEKEIKRIKFDYNDRMFIDILCRYMRWENLGYEYTMNPYTILVPSIIKKMHCYSSCDSSAVRKFLIDIGVWPQWYNPALETRSVSNRSTSSKPPVSKLRATAETCAKQYLQSSSDAKLSADAHLKTDTDIEVKTPWRPDIKASNSPIVQLNEGVIGKTQFYERDICESIRHDFGDLPVYTIDNSETVDVDDGVSIETITGADGKTQKWIHVHVADPSALIHPGHIVADAASELMTSIYFAETANHMLPFDLVVQHLSLIRRADGRPVNTMTFSALIEPSGEIVDFKIRPGLVRNIQAIPYESLDRYLNYDHATGSMNSFAKVQDMARNSMLIHPFVPTANEWKRYGEGYAPLSDQAIKELREIQRITNYRFEHRLRHGYINLFGKSLDVKVDLDGNTQNTALDKPRFLFEKMNRSGRGVLEYPRIRLSYSEDMHTPAHVMVMELMIIAGQVAARYANTHGQVLGKQGLAKKPVPMLYRVQEHPDLSMLNGCTPDMPLAFDNMSMEEAQSAENVWNAMLAEARAKKGCITAKTKDEVRHMMSPGLVVDRPGVHSTMGITDQYGYVRVTSPIRRLDDLIIHWQLKAQMLAEHMGVRDQQPWFWKQTDITRLAPILFRKEFLSKQLMKMNGEFWAMTLMQRMDFEARRGRLQLPPPGFYDESSEYYRDLPWCYYNPSKPGPLIWTATVDNRDAGRFFISVIISGGLGARAALVPRPVERERLPFAGTKVRVQLQGVDPVTTKLMVKLAPEEYQPPETPKFWSSNTVLCGTYAQIPSMHMLPENMPTVTP
ncbi:3'-5' RNA exonuclease complex component [Coemansia brasiliensis]|uniref:3'-5' RNA exonuclease complex component n=1 Tax=Coemansia brasiliensis TaxID=2650707 RepID=A0A9W8LZU8_9FUNG|nr:3'-5' RNA exonuclease complex component [Coemansia brasiliensis]